MDVFRITGGRPLTGEVSVGGAKNAALPIIIATLLVEKGVSVVRNVPDLRDIHTTLRVLEHLGVETTFDREQGEIKLDTTRLSGFEAPYELVQKMRASFLVMGPLLARLGRARISLPGGCAIGTRPVDQHLKAFAAMGAGIGDEGGYIVAEAAPLKGGRITFDRPSHTGTENVLMAAVLAEGQTTIINAACDPEVVDLAAALSAAGARIDGAGSTRIEVEGVTGLNPIDYRVMTDRLEAGTFLVAGAITGGRVRVRGARGQDLEMVLAKLAEMGVDLIVEEDAVQAALDGRPGPVNLTTFPYPGFPTDLQAAVMALATIADGTSVIRETVFEDRFLHTAELARLGARVRTLGDEATVIGIPALSGASVMASDIRAGAGLVLACLAARGDSVVNRVYHIDRGYERLEERLCALGAQIVRQSD